MDRISLQEKCQNLVEAYASATNVNEVEEHYKSMLDALLSLNQSQIRHFLIENELVGTVIIDTIRFEVFQQRPSVWRTAADILILFLKTDIADVSTETLVPECFQVMSHILVSSTRTAELAEVLASAMQLLHTLHYANQSLVLMNPSDAMQYGEYFPEILRIISASRSANAIERTEQTLVMYLRRLLQKATKIIGETISNVVDGISETLTGSPIYEGDKPVMADVAEVKQFIPFGAGDAIVAILVEQKNLFYFPRVLDVLFRCFASVCAYPIFRFKTTSLSSSATKNFDDNQLELFRLYLGAIESGQSCEMSIVASFLKNLQSLWSDGNLDTFVQANRATLVKVLAPIAVTYHPLAQAAAKSFLFALMQRPVSQRTQSDAASLLLRRTSSSTPKHVTLLDVFLTSPFATLQDLRAFMEGLLYALENFTDFIPESYETVLLPSSVQQASTLEMMMMDINEVLLVVLQKLLGMSALETAYKSLLGLTENLLTAIPDSCRGMLTRDTCDRLAAFPHFKMHTAVKRFQQLQEVPVERRIVSDYPIARAMAVQQADVIHHHTAAAAAAGHSKGPTTLLPKPPPPPPAPSMGQKRGAFDSILADLMEAEERSGALESEQEAKRRKLFQQDYRPPPPPPPPAAAKVTMPPPPPSAAAANELNASSLIRYLPYTSKSTSSSLSAAAAASAPKHQLPPPPSMRRDTPVIDLTDRRPATNTSSSTSSSTSSAAPTKPPAAAPLPPASALLTSSSLVASSLMPPPSLAPTVAVKRVRRRQRSFINEDDTYGGGGGDGGDGDDDFDPSRRLWSSAAIEPDAKDLDGFFGNLDTRTLHAKQQQERHAQNSGDASSLHSRFDLQSFLSGQRTNKTTTTATTDSGGSATATAPTTSTTATTTTTVASSGGLAASDRISDETRRRYAALQQQQQQQQPSSAAFSLSAVQQEKQKQLVYSAEYLTQVSVDRLCEGIVRMQLEKIVAALLNSASGGGGGDRDRDRDRNREKEKEKSFAPLPIRFVSEDAYIDSFQPLLVEEFKTALGQFFTSHEDAHGPANVLYITMTHLQRRNPPPGAAQQPDAGQGASEAADERLREALVCKDTLYYQRRAATATAAASTAGSGNGSGSGNGWQELQKDDLVMLLPRAAAVKGDMRMKDLVSLRGYALGIVASTATRGRGGGGGGGSSSSSSGGAAAQLMLVDAEKVSQALHFHQRRTATTTTTLSTGGAGHSAAATATATAAYGDAQLWIVIPIMNLSTFFREWTALHSIRDHRLMPLAPYLLKASPAVSQARLIALKQDIERRFDSWVQEEQYEQHRKQQQQQQSGSTAASSSTHNNPNRARLLENRHRQLVQSEASSSSSSSALSLASTHASFSMKEQLEQVLFRLIHEDLAHVKIDTSLLKNSDIVRTLRRMSKHDPPLPSTVREAIQRLIQTWQTQCTNDLSPDVIRNLKGGKVVPIPNKEEDCMIQPPRTVTATLWQSLYDRYNNSQLFAIKYVVEAFDSSQDTRVCLVQGPPGTGKTSTILGMVSALLGRSAASTATAAAAAALPRSPTTTAELRRAISEDASVPRLLICAPSNAAIDEILVRLYQHGVYTGGSGGSSSSGGPSTRVPRMVRLGDVLSDGSAHSVNAQIVTSLTLTYQVEKALQVDPVYLERQVILQAIREAEQALATATPSDTAASGRPTAAASARGGGGGGNQRQTQEESVHQATQVGLAQLRQQLHRNLIALERRRGEIRLQLLYEAEVVASTLSSTGKQQFLDYIIKENVLFHTTIIDEAAQTTEPASLIPLRFGCRRLVLVGDPRQLPATVLSRAAEKAGLGRSLFERLELAEHEVVMLTIQYRMHPEIRQFPSLYFYQQLLVDAPHIVQETTLRSMAATMRKLRAQQQAGEEQRRRRLALEDGEVRSDDVVEGAKEAEEEVDDDDDEDGTHYVTTALITDQAQWFDAGTRKTAAAAGTVGTVAPVTLPADEWAAVAITRQRPLAPVTFYHIGLDPRSHQGEQTAGTSFVNEYEARAMMQWLKQLPRSVLEDEDLSIAIIVPYKAQVRLVRQWLRKEPQLAYLLGPAATATGNNNDRSRRGGGGGGGGGVGGGSDGNRSGRVAGTPATATATATSGGIGRIEVNTVDGFQGREKDIVLYGTVRSKASHTAQSSVWIHRHDPQQNQHQQRSQQAGISAIGFVADERRINVALTRAKKLLAIFGNVYTLAQDTLWRALIVDVERRGTLYLPSSSSSSSSSSHTASSYRR